MTDENRMIAPETSVGADEGRSLKICTDRSITEDDEEIKSFEEMQDYLKMLYGLKKKDRIFTISKSYLHHEMDRGSKAAGVKRIRIHDLRHSHVSLLIDMGFTPVAIADRLGHESIEVTLRYAHLFPSKQTEMIERLEKERMVETNVS